MESYSSEEKIYWGHKEPVVSPSEKDLGKNITKNKGKGRHFHTGERVHIKRAESMC